MSMSRASNQDVHKAINNNELNLDSASYEHFIESAHYHTNRLCKRYPSQFNEDEETLRLIEIRLAAHYFLSANPVAKEIKGDDHSVKFNVAAPTIGVMGTPFGRSANMLSDGKLLLMEDEYALKDAFLLVA